MEQIELIKWTDEFSVGVARMDEQHRRLIRMINRLLQKPEATTQSESISDLLTEMTGYASEHFRAEEELMSEYGYPRLEDQRLQHKEFRRKTVDFCSATTIGASSVPNTMLTYLREWLVHHILREDMEYKSFFQDKGL